MRNLLIFLLASVIGLSNVLAQPKVEKVNPKDFEVRYCGSSAKYMHGKHLDYNQGKPKFISINMFPLSLIDTCGSFNLYYEDLSIGSGEGFDHPTLGPDRRNTFCAVLNYVESVIDIPAGTTIDIFVDQSLTPVALPAIASDRFLARAAPFYAPGGYGVVSGIFGGNMHEHITTGIDPDALNYDGHVQVNFDAIGGTTNINYWNDYTTTTATCRYDLYTVLLHEVTHAMGWLSAVREAPVTLLAECVNMTNSFTLYDQEFLYFGEIANPATFAAGKVVLGPPGNPSINPFINTFPTPLRTNEIWLNDQASPVNHPIYSGSLDPFYMVSSGSLLSHLNYVILSFTGMAQFSPGFQPDYVMGASVEKEELRRTWTLGELRALLILGYGLNTAFSASNSLNGVTNNNTLLTANEPAYRSNVATPVTQYFNSNFADQIPADFPIANSNTTLDPTVTVLTIDLAADPNLNDNNGDPISIMPGTLFGIRGVSDGLNDHNRLAQVSPTVIEYTPEPGYHGRAQFGFYLWDGHERGGLKVYTIDVDPSGAFVVPLGGELVINGGYEDGTEVRQRFGNPTFPNTAIIAWKAEGYGTGKHYSGAHPYVNLSNNWNIGAGTNIIDTWKNCYHSTTPATLGQFGLPTISSGAGVNSKPIPTAAVPNNERMQRFIGGFNFSTLYNPMSTCGYYRFECDLAFPSGAFTVGQNWDMDLEFITDPGTNPTGFTVIETIPVTVTVTAVYTSGLDAWTHVTADFFYCGATQVEHINLVPVSGGAYIDNISIVQQPDPAPMTVTATPDVTICLGGSTQLDVLSVTDPRCDLIYTWVPSTGLSDPNITNPIATPTVTTTYLVTVSDIYNCSSAAAQVTVLVAPGPDATIAPAGPFCENDPAVNLTAASIGGTWSGPGITNVTTGTFDPAVAGVGTWTVTYTNTDLNGCVDTDVITIFISSLPNIEAGNDTTICEGVSLTIGGNPTGPINSNFNWTPAATLDNNTLPNPIASPSVTTEYIVTVTDSNGCVGMDSILITVNPTPVINSSNDTSMCIGACYQLNASGGVSYLWSPSIGLSNNTIANPVACPLVTTIYIVTGTDLNGCSDTAATLVTINPLPTVTINADTSVCIGTCTQLSASGGTGYSWTPGITLSDPVISNPLACPINTTMYTVSVVDGNGCLDTASVVITVDTLPIIFAGVDTSICIGDSIQLTATGGISYAWTPAIGLSDTTISNPIANPNVTTTYIVTVTDSFGCSGIDTVTVAVDILPVIIMGVDTSICLGDCAQILASGGSSYLWSPGGTLSDFTIANPIACPTVTTTYVVDVSGLSFGGNMVVNGDFESGNTGFTSGLPFNCSCLQASYCVDAEPKDKCASGLWTNDLWDHTFGTSAGNYMLIDGSAVNNNLVWSQSGLAVVSGSNYNFSFWVMPEISNGSTQPSFNIEINGTIIGTFSTASLPSQTWVTYSTIWNAAFTGAATLEIRQINPIEGFNDYGIDDISFSGETVVLCAAKDSLIVTVNPIPTIITNNDTAVCESDCVQLNTTGGISYTWSPSIGLSNDNIANPLACPLTTTTYIVTGIDTSGCSSTDTITITINPPPTAAAGNDQEICVGGSVVIGGAPTGPAGATYVWSPSGTLDNNTLANPTGSPLITTTYTVLVTDTNGCVGMDTADIIVFNPPVITITSTDATCNGACDGTATVAVASGTAPLTFSWSNSASTQNVSGLCPGTYDVTVTDANGCTVTAATTIYNPAPITITIIPTGPFCENDPALNLTASPASGAWSGTGITDPMAGIFDPAVAGFGQHTITYVVGTAPCIATATIDIDVLPAPTVGIAGPTILCTGTQGLVTLCVLTSAPAPSISWSNGATTTCISVPAPTASVSYSVSITNAYGCSTTAYHSIYVVPLPVVNIVPSSLTFCLNDAPVSILAVPATGGVWTGNGITNPATGIFDPAVAGVGVHTITYTYTDGNGCVNSDVVPITVSSLPPLAVLFPVSDVCVGDPCFNVFGLSLGNGTVTANPGPIGTTNNWFVFDWAQFCPAAAGTGPQTVTLTTAPNAYGCVNTATQSFNVNDGPAISFPSVSIDLCTYIGPVALSGLTSGGMCTLTGPYVTGGLFDAAAAGVGTHTVTWTCVDGTCSSTTTGTVIVVDNAQWHQTTSQTAVNDVNNDVVTDLKNNVYVVGTFTKSTQIGDPALTISTSTGSSGAYVARYDDCGALIWVANTKLGVAEGNGIAIDEQNGVVYIVGTYKEEIVMADAQSPALLCTAGFSQMINSPAGVVSGFVAQFDMATGCLYFIENVLLPPYRYVDLRTVEVNNNNGSIYVGGRYAFSSGSTNFRVLARKYSPAIGIGASLGAPVWDILPLGDGPTQVLNDLDYDENWNRLWMTGNYNPKIQFPGLPTLNASNSSPITTPDAFLAVSMDLGFIANTIMARKGNVQMGGSMTGEGIAVDDANGSPYWTGTYSGSVPSAYQIGGFSLPIGASANAYMMGYNYAGGVLWRQVGVGFGNGQVVGKDVDVNNGQVYYTGDFQNGDISLSGIGTYPFIGTLGNGFWHVYAASYTSNGVGLWGNVTKNNVPLKEDHHANGINAAKDLHVYIAGKYTQTMDYLVGAPTSGPLVSTTISAYPYATNAYVMRSEKSPAGAFQKTSGPELLQLAETDFLKTDEAVMARQSGHGFEVYPSPTSGESTLRIENFNPTASYELAVTNLLGDILIETTLQQPVSKLDLSAYENGVYMVKVSSTSGSITRTVVKY